MQGEAASIDAKVSRSRYPEDLTKITNKGGCIEQQFFNADETAFYWKKMASRTFTVREKSILASKSQRTDWLSCYGLM